MCSLFCLATLHKFKGGGAKSSEMNVDGVKLIKLNRANLECSGGEIQRVECGWFKVDKIE